MKPFSLALVLAFSARAQDWPVYGGDADGTRYSPLKQITRANVARLKPAWTFHTGDFSDGTEYPVKSAFEATPLMIDGVLYVVSAFDRLIALEPETGKQLWAFDPKLDRTKSQMLLSSRGAAFWTDGTRKRLFYGTLDGQLWSIDANTGKAEDGFGTGGFVDLRAGMIDPGEKRSLGRGYGMTSPPAVYKDVVVCGSIVPDSEPLGPNGDVRAFDARTGKLVWRFHTVARPGEFGGDTWEGDSARGRGGANMWSIPTIDTKRGIAFLPLTSPSYDHYGGDRKGAGLFGDALVAVDALTGKRLWHFQTVHHNLWDYDIPAPPTLVTVRHDGKLVDAVAQVTKTGFTFLFERTTGKPLFDIVETPVPPSEVPGEAAYPTQPFPVKPPPFERQSFRLEELTDVTPESRAFCSKLIEGATFGDLYTPLGLKPTVLFPGTNGGANWGGASFDPETHTLYVNSMDVGMIFRMFKMPAGSKIPYRARGMSTPSSRFWDQQRLPCQKPPWGALTAIDLDKGEFRWRSVLGVVDALIDKKIPPTGTANMGGSIETAGGLVFIGATDDSRLRAFDKETGKELWTERLPASAHATPMTFLSKKDGKQYVVIAAGGGNKYNDTYSDSLVAFCLP
ncbi:MAG: pyrroloquinoline quinone-dependent dehydrogenase [Acidobacteriota bacterium]|nr:pyrroloquinoline quinone-dependent dehydrogenase [Acidobacteriota bacterium]